jgi:hypothetical protein
MDSTTPPPGPPLHPTIEQFQARAELLDMMGSKATLDDALAQLAAWMDLVRPNLTEDDFAVLVEIGGMLYREGLRQRIAKRGAE